MKKALIISLTLNCLIVIFIGAKRYYYTYGSGKGNSPITDSTFELWNRMRTSVYRSLPIDSADIVFAGNSLTEGFPVTEIYGQKVKNRGISGNTTKQLIGRIEMIAKCRPRKIFIEIGVNDLRLGVTPNEVIANYARIVESINKYSPATDIYIQSITPTRGDYGMINDSIAACNKLLIDFCNKSNVTFIDLYSRLVNNSQLDSTLTGDGIHLNAKGYKLWETAIDNYLQDTIAPKTTENPPGHTTGHTGQRMASNIK